MDKKKTLIGLSVTAIMLLSLLASMLYSVPVMAVDPEDWYTTIEGVLGTDKYSLYPFEEKSLKVGLSKFGELINSKTNVGLEYAGERDPFAAPVGSSVDDYWLPKSVWINGWFMDIIYNHSSWGVRHVWAGALFADLSSHGGPWLWVDDSVGSDVNEANEDFQDPGVPIDDYGDPMTAAALQYGGRKTNGTAVTEPMVILYDGPRLFVAKLTTHIYDYNEVSETKIHIVDFVITVMFNKVKKEVIVIKDVKFIPHYKYLLRPLTIYVKVRGEDDDEVSWQEVTIDKGILIQLSNREEWDLGPEDDYSSYVHFYVAGTGNGEGQSTVYDDAWTMLPTLPAGVKATLPGGGTVVINRHGGEPQSGAGTYDVAQIISKNKAYVGWHAFWPSLSDWEADGGRANVWWRALKDNDPHNTDSGATPNDEPFFSPLIIGEWDFVLSDMERKVGYGVEADVQFRGVSVYGVTDYNDGYDDDMDKIHGDDIDVIDSEVKYQLAEIFNPWDLLKAVTKKNTSRHVLFVEGPKDVDYNVTLGDNLVSDTEWDAYCSFAERVILLPEGILWTRGDEYNLVDTDEDGWLDAIMLKEAIGEGETLKILYSTYGSPFLCGEDWINAGRYEWIIVGRDAATVDSAGAAMVAAAFKNKLLEDPDSIYIEVAERIRELIKGGTALSGAEIGLAGADMFNPVIANQMPWVMHKFGSGDAWEDYYYDYEAGDYRTALKDDWCTTWPISSSNMIGVGGPLANLLAYYGNDFAQAIYGLDQFTDYAPWENHIIPLTCWDMTKTRAFNSSETVGYAVISTYKDINGTVLLLIWGHWGRDTYYVTKWFYEEGICQLQDAPPGITSIVVKITYESTGEGYKPTGYSIVECLGTISERLWTHGCELKGGLHDP